MSSFRVHAVAPSGEGRIPYLVLRDLGNDEVSLDLAPLEIDPANRVPHVTLSTSSLYEILSGKETVLDRMDGRVTLVPHEEFLLIACDAHGTRPGRDYRVWLSEMGLGWNMLAH